MKHFILLIVSLPFLLVSCKNPSSNTTAKEGEGHITYKVSYPDSTKYGMKSQLFPESMDLLFKNEKATFVASGGMGTIQLVNILDSKKKEYNSLLIDAIRQNVACKLTPDEVKENENSSSYTYEYTNDTKIIAGLECKKAIAKNSTDNSTVIIYYYDKIKFYYFNSPFRDFNYLMMEYTHTINDLTMKLEATSIDLKTPIDTTMFEVRGDFIWLHQKQFYNYLNTL